MKRRFLTSLALLVAGATLAGCIVERDPYWYRSRPHWQNSYDDHHHYHRGYYWR